MRSDDVELAILDMNLHSGTDGRDGIELLRKIKILRPDMPVILISAWGTIPLAVEGMNYWRRRLRVQALEQPRPAGQNQSRTG